MNSHRTPLTLQVNGQKLPLPHPPTLDALLDTLNLNPQSVVIEHNGIALLRREITSRPLAPDDHLEILKITAGG